MVADGSLHANVARGWADGEVVQVAVPVSRHGIRGQGGGNGCAWAWRWAGHGRRDGCGEKVGVGSSLVGAVWGWWISREVVQRERTGDGHVAMCEWMGVAG